MDNADVGLLLIEDNNPNINKDIHKVLSNGKVDLRKSSVASSQFGLTVILNPNEAEYGNAVKNNYIGFKTLIHSPYAFAEVDGKGKAIGKNSEAFFAIRAYHTRTTDQAMKLELSQRNCLAHDEDLSKYPNINLNIFANYSRQACLLECQAHKLFYECGCLPYHYPDFHLVWKTDTTCDYEGLKCLAKIEGRYLFLSYIILP